MPGAPRDPIVLSLRQGILSELADQELPSGLSRRQATLGAWPGWTHLPRGQDRFWELDQTRKPPCAQLWEQEWPGLSHPGVVGTVSP
ncbi:unnamed protein product [Rangifer tarandus platyrhynchus]|uniref:Uncharacterized protein n=2 Tax=Rangifer tarandus platyrhynchus TaxID=3082113 RepID=A0ABN8Y115_RANTA|nr:unnamed protein product [Rangifer tarandus platyrhynchus]CAI9692751.1 unnamed protein product [Rangifer tarandus platyrhynchus]